MHLRQIVVLTLLACTLAAVPLQAKPHWYRSKRFWAGLVIDAAALTADCESSQQVFARGGFETNRIYGGPRPGMPRMMAVGLPLAFAWSYVGYRMSESSHAAFRTLWWAPVGGDAANHVRLALHNLHVCPANECAVQR